MPRLFVYFIIIIIFLLILVGWIKKFKQTLGSDAAKDPWRV